MRIFIALQTFISFWFWLIEGRGGSLLFLFKKMELGVQLIQGFVFGIRTFNATEDIPYNEVQLFAGPICLYLIWE